jgi:hypothetical protein
VGESHAKRVVQAGAEGVSIATGLSIGDPPVQRPKKPRWRAPQKVRKPRRKIPKWTYPMHWDPATGELFGARPLPRPSYPAFRPSKFIITGAKPEEVAGESEAVGKWFEEEYVPKSLRVWAESQEHHTNDQNILEARRHRVIYTSGYTGSHGVDAPKSPRIECSCVNCRRLPP